MAGLNQQLVLIVLVIGTLFLSSLMPFDWQGRVQTIRDCLIVVWGVSLLNFVFLGGGLNRLLGVRPREPLGLLGVLFSPLVHHDLTHLIANTLPFTLLSWLVLLQAPDRFYAITLVIAAISGFGTWILGRTAVHVGASGIIFGYFGYLLARGYLDLTLATVGLALLALMLYGGQVGAMVPSLRETSMSWEAHLFGFLGGIWAAYSAETLSRVEQWLTQLLAS